MFAFYIAETQDEKNLERKEKAIKVLNICQKNKNCNKNF